MSRHALSARQLLRRCDEAARACACARAARDAPRARVRCRPRSIGATFGRVQRRAGVEHARCRAPRPAALSERLPAASPSIPAASRTLQRAVAGHRQAEVLRDGSRIRGPRRRFSSPTMRRRAERDLVHAVLAVDHQRVLGAQALQHAHLDADQVGMEHAHQDVRRAGRVGQRAEDVEDRAHAELLAHRRRRSSSRGWWLGANMKPMPVSSMQCATCVRRQVDVGAERFEHVGAAATC